VYESFNGYVKHSEAGLGIGNDATACLVGLWGEAPLALHVCPGGTRADSPSSIFVNADY